MKNVLIRPKDIKNCWETDDACIIEQYDKRKWICEKYFNSRIDNQDWNTMVFIHAHKADDIIELQLKGKGGKYGQK